MAAAGLKRARALLSAVLVFVAAALAVPALALAQGTGGPGEAEIEVGQAGETGGAAGGGLGGTGFDAWQIALAGVVCIALALVLLRSRRARGSEVA